MTHRVHPYIFRIGGLTTWKSRWFNPTRFQEYLREDTLLRAWLERTFRAAHLKAVEIERFPNSLHIIFKTARPGILIGRGGEGAQKIKRDIERFLARLGPRPARSKYAPIPAKKPEIKITIEEVRSPETHAAIAAQMMVEDIEKRLPFRRALKQALDKISSAREVQGVKIAIKGRLDGAEMARYEWGKRGRIPLQTLRADVDYAEKTAYTAYGTIGVKVWIYKGDVYEKEVGSRK
ncbi:MAG: 30S ribosomal protein S3 [Candidatus Sungbacteria bacterium RIFCSPHIGHO2_02_FULL_52_23]|uniref:Small ribosomal subunit protein uS3 n=1 Tax=Candidatus Sungbacteria bacterium RIFCSPHIGHO2_02_FULL_52_23 TaxID=1802274 RepID=A0A1G2KX18_9BACT|nr:MAG: 30S ribosomal protein S3 [Candidatus Sungbacteria bacterium RIFCSPHIGHO2_02_FULL_52_23]